MGGRKFPYTVSHAEAAAANRSQRWGEGRGSPPPQGLDLTSRGALMRALEPAGTAPSLLTWGPPRITCLPEAQDLPLTSLSTWRPPLFRPVEESPMNSCSLTVGHSWEGPTAALANGRAGPLTVTQRRLVTWGRSPLQCQPIAEQDH